MSYSKKREKVKQTLRQVSKQCLPHTVNIVLSASSVSPQGSTMPFAKGLTLKFGVSERQIISFPFFLFLGWGQEGTSYMDDCGSQSAIHQMRCRASEAM